MPRSAVRLRLACLWPILIGLETLALLVENDAWLDPARVSKVNRNSVYRVLWRSTALVMSDGALRNWMDGLVARIDKSLR